MCHSRESGNPVSPVGWIPAFAGMTRKVHGGVPKKQHTLRLHPLFLNPIEELVLKFQRSFVGLDNT
jgi:hypothetical protein